MNIFNGFTYRLLRTFSLTTTFCGFLLLYMSLKAIRGNAYFFIWSMVMFGAAVFFGLKSWKTYKNPPVYMTGNAEVYGAICPKCKEMIKVDEKHCPKCGESIE